MVKELKWNVYESSPDLYDDLMSTRFEINNLKTVMKEIKGNLSPEKTLILDLCCGTGVLAKMLSGTPRIKFIGVDRNEAFLEAAKEKTRDKDNFEFVLKDVLNYETLLRFDIVILTSAYHHIENEHKTRLLEKVYKVIKDDGFLIIYETVIPSYSNKKEFERSNEEYYTQRMEYIKRTEGKNLSKRKLDVLMNVWSLSKLAKDEYKVDYDYLIRDLDKTGFKVLKRIKVWPKGTVFRNESVGDFVFVVKKK